MYLHDTNWKDKFLEQTNNDTELLNKTSPRTGILINTSTNDVYLFATISLLGSAAALRSAMMLYVGITENSSSSWQALLTDGGKSTQMVCQGLSLRTLPTSRPVPQIIALKNKT